MKQNYFYIIFAFFLFSCSKKEENKKLIAQKDYYDSVKKVTVHVIPEELLEDKSDSIKLYYKKFNNFEIWIDQENRADLIAQIEKSKLEGLNPDDYKLETIYNKEVVRDSLSKIDLLQYDILLTETFAKLATHYYKGKLNPKEVNPSWELFEKKINISPLLIHAISNKKIASTLKELLPQHIQYKMLKEALVEIDNYPNVAFDSLYFTKKIIPNDTIKQIIKIKKRLRFWNDLTSQDSISSIYDSITVKAVKKFQFRHGLTADGIIGKSTLDALNWDKIGRKKQIIANLERWKWYPKDFGDKYILVNLPDYTLNLICNNDTLAQRKVVVGKPKRKSIVLNSKMSNIVYNPTWTVPPTIIKEDLSVEAARNRSYFSRNRIKIYNSKNQEISPNNWNPNKPNNYRYVQDPGYNNSLGLVKFNFPNNHLVYLHDTNHREMFVLNYRALSSGCVRIENPLEISELILQDQDNGRWNKETINEIIERKKTYMIKVKNPIYIHQLYWTSWAKKNRLYFRDDIYKVDLELYSKLRS